MAWYMVWPDWHDIVNGTVCRVMACFIVLSDGQWYGIWYGLAVKALYMVWPGMHGIVHGMA